MEDLEIDELLIERIDEYATDDAEQLEDIL